jgi:hypothetical protein
MIAESLNIPKAVVLRILKEDLGRRQLCARFVPHTIKRSPTKLQVFANFLLQKILQPFIAPPCSPDLSPPDYFLFRKLKMKLKGLHFADVAEIQHTVTDELKKV